MGLIDKDTLLESLKDLEANGGSKMYRKALDDALHDFFPKIIEDQQIFDFPPNAPLTLEELRGMDGEPVWVQYGQYDGEWLIVAWNIYDAISYARKAPFKPSVYSYGDTWLAYRRKPEEGTP